MKVALLTSDRERCGIARYSRDLLAALTPLADVDLVPIHPWPPEGERLERLRTADVVHLQHEYSFWGAAFPPPRAYYEGLERFRRPGRLVITAHTVADAETVVAARGGGLKPLAKRLALRLRPGLREAIEADPFRPPERVIVHSPAAVVLGKRLGRPEAVQFWPMPVPAWSVPASEWEPLAQRLRLEGRRLITIFGFVTPEKGYEMAMYAVRLVQDDHPNVVLVIAGGARNEQSEQYLSQLQSIGHSIYVEASTGRTEASVSDPGEYAMKVTVPILTRGPRFTGYLADADARAILEHSEVALLPYRSATGSYAAGAALAAGCPLVTSDLPAFQEPLPALRFHGGDVQDLAQKLNAIIADDDFRAELGRRSREYAAANSWAAAAERHAALYQELLG
jgi:glycosyltransferase involved in cell wall biosynthesis